MTIRSLSRCSYLLLVLIVVGCSVPKIPQEQSPPVLPGAYLTSTDTLNSVSGGWKVFLSAAALRELIDTVLAGNPDLAMAARRVEAARAMTLQSKGAMFPTVNATAMPSLRRFGAYTMDGAGNRTTEIESGKTVPVNLPDLYLGFQASWEVDLWGKLKNRKKAAMARFLSSAEGRNLVQTQLVAETAAAYYELVGADHQLNLLEQTIQLQEQAVDMVKVQKQAAVVNELAVQQFEAQVLNLKSMREDVLREIDLLESRINLMAGRLPRPIPRDTAGFVSKDPPVVHTGVPSALLRNRPDVRQAEWALAASRADLQAARAAYFPTLTITGGLGMQAYRPGLLFAFPESIAYGIFAGLTAPVLNRSAIKSEYSRASAMQLEAIHNYRKYVVQGFSEVQLELKRLQRLQRVHDLKQQETSMLSSSTVVSDALFRTGRAAYLEVLIARQNALRANMELIAARRDQYLSTVNLYRALGGGWQDR